MRGASFPQRYAAHVGYPSQGPSARGPSAELVTYAVGKAKVPATGGSAAYVAVNHRMLDLVEDGHPRTRYAER